MTPLGRRMGRRTRKAEHLELGDRGEACAAAWLAARGFVVLERNLRTRHAELDILAMEQKVLVAIEVKTRSNHLAPEHLVDTAKLARLQAALRQLRGILAPRARGLRVDVVAVRWALPEAAPEILHFRGDVRLCDA